MAISPQWLIFAVLTVLGSLTYNVCSKLATTNSNIFIFAFLITLSSFILTSIYVLVAHYGFKINVTEGLNAKGVAIGVAAGIGVTLIDIAFFFALRYGSAISSQLFWSVGGTAAFTLAMFLFFHESLTLTKAFGILFGIASLILVTL